MIDPVLANRQLQGREITTGQLLATQLKTTGLFVIDGDHRPRFKPRRLEANDREGLILPTLETGWLKRVVLGNLQQRFVLTLAVGAQGLTSRRPAHLKHRLTGYGLSLIHI